MEMTDRLSTLTLGQQISVVKRVFQKLLMAFGNQMQAKWQGLDMNDVYEDWAEALQHQSLGAINYGIQAAKSEQHPPSQGEFIAHCKRYNPDNGFVRLDNKISPEQMEINRARIAEIARKFAEGSR